MLPLAPSTPRRRSNRVRRVATWVLGIAVAALTLSGCVAMKSFSAVQQGSLGSIDIRVAGCGSKAGNQDCGLGSSGLESNLTGTGQVLLGFEIDARFVPPATFEARRLFGIDTYRRTFTESPSYTAELTRLDPPSPGRKWAGYISDARGDQPGIVAEATVPIIRPLLPDGSPASGFPVNWRIGSRGVLAPDAPATRPVTCGDSLSAVFQADLTICSDDSGGYSNSGFNDFAFLTPAPVTVQAGQTAVIPVVGKLTGPAQPAINFALAASTTLPGTTALTNVPTLAPPGESTTSVSVSVAVPPGTAPGTYGVTLTGTLATGETRAATGAVIVAGPGGAGGGVAGGAPLADLGISRTSISNGRRAAPAVISVTLATPGRLRVVLERKLAGRKKSGRCVAPTSALRRSGASPCSRFVPVSAFTRAGLGAGVATVNISGRGRAPGSYRVSLTHIEAAGVASLPAVRIPLTIRR